MSLKSKTAVIIPARMGSSRLNGKVLADIQGKPMVVRVLECGLAADIGDVFVACCEQEVFDVVTAAGGKAIMTDPALPSGTDRVSGALESLDSKYEYIVNLQGDLPTVPPHVVASVMKPFETGMDIDVSTIVVKASEEENDSLAGNPHSVKAALSFEDANNASAGRAFFFSRSPVRASDGAFYHHIGLYGYTRKSLAQFVALPQSPFEKYEKLEQLRGLEAGFKIGAQVVDWTPFEVNTPEDLEQANS